MHDKKTITVHKIFFFTKILLNALKICWIFYFSIGLASSDKYLKLASQDREKSRKKTKHGKTKKKKKGQPMVESDEDVPVQHTVSTLVDMPEVSFLSQGHYG